MTTEKPTVSPKPNFGPRSPIKHNFENPILPDPNSHYDNAPRLSPRSPTSPTGPEQPKSPLEKNPNIFKKITPKFSPSTIMLQRNNLSNAGGRRPSAKFEKLELQLKPVDDEQESSPEEPSPPASRPVPQQRNTRPQSSMNKPTFQDKPLPSKVNLPSGVLMVQVFKRPPGDCPDAPKRVPDMVARRREVLEDDQGTSRNSGTKEDETYEDMYLSKTEPKSAPPISPRKSGSPDIPENTG